VAEEPPRHDKESFDSLHGDLLDLLDRICTQDDHTLAMERFAIMEGYGYTATFLTGPRGLVDG
jgi:hypothetical protein